MNAGIEFIAANICRLRRSLSRRRLLWRHAPRSPGRVAPAGQRKAVSAHPGDHRPRPQRQAQQGALESRPTSGQRRTVEFRRVANTGRSLQRERPSSATTMNSTRLFATAPNTWPECVTVNWRRLSSGLWRVPEGDIHAAYSAESFPRVAVFTHAGRLFTNCGVHYHGPVHAEANCYPLIPQDEYRGPEPRQYTLRGTRSRLSKPSLSARTEGRL